MDQVEIAHIEDISLDDHRALSLLQLLSNSLILYHTIPLLDPLSILNLGGSSKAFRDLVFKTPNVFRYLDLTRIKSARSEVGSVDNGAEVWRNVQVDENVTEDDFYGGPLRGIFTKLRQRDILKDVQTLILDGLAVPSDLVAEIILDQAFNVRLLSVREVQHLNEPKLMQALQYAVRPSRPKNTPRLEGLYIFGPKDPSPARFRRKPDDNLAISSTPVQGGILSTRGAQIGAEWNRKSGDALWQALEDADRWFERSGQVVSRQILDRWADTLHACHGIISFDAVLCCGPRHSPAVGVRPESDTSGYLPPAVATFSIDGCSGCGSSPEGFSRYRSSPIERFPLLSPLPLQSSSAKSAKAPLNYPHGVEKKLLVRCADCLRQRHCNSCQRWWCENCYKVQAPGGGIVTALGVQAHESNTVKIGVMRSCFECGFNCISCVNRTQLLCKICAGGYCTIHNEGSTLTTAGRHSINGCRC
ncbi:hypothetical protein PVAG01_03471 [Phlyctema vagabunda]|uniref:Ubiquitin fusion degradation protein n=1 Tax=Phlyctema vagabunda TaxID=108571 RepID=A0ABR4PLL6_9HELO